MIAEEMLTASVVLEYQERKNQAKTIREFKAIGRELRDKYNLSSDIDAINLLNNVNVLEILKKYEELGWKND